jgi:DNA-binding FadR family transcriptional regulator
MQGSRRRDSENIPQPAVDLAGLAVRVSIHDLYEMRKLIEVRVAGWAAMRATPSEIEEISAHCRCSWPDFS